MNCNALKLYKAKDNNKTIYEHSQEVKNILLQLNNIHYINYLKELIECSWLHDIGKVTDEFQNNICSTHRNVRHELLSASYKDLTDMQRMIILFHHKYKNNLNINSSYYKQQLDEIKGKLKSDFINIIDDKVLLNVENSDIKDINYILNLGYFKLADHIASAEIKKIDIGLNCKNIYQFKNYTTVQNTIRNNNFNNVMIISPTGSGKTEASLLWSDTVQNTQKSRRIFYLLPYTASINALYKRLKKDNISVGVLHSKVNSLLHNEDDIDNIEEEKQLFQKNIKQVTICTIYQILKATFGSKNYEMKLAQFKNSIFIVDEIHCFELKELTFLLETLRWLKDILGINICIMSASIPQSMQDLITNKLNINNVIKAKDSDFKIRHKIHYCNNNIEDSLNDIYKAIDKNKKTLICVNQVNISQKIYSILINKYKNKNIKLIHGRFNDKDRAIIEKDIDNCDILIGTQAIEVSLDIDYDILFTEIAPLDSLLQRFGRANRKGRKGISDIYIFQSDNNIYDKDLINNTYNEIQNIIKDDNGIIYENKVNKYLDLVYPKIDLNTYNTYKNNIDYFINSLSMGEYSIQSNIEDVINENTYKTVKMLPISLLDTYLDLKNNKKYIEANELFVNANPFIFEARKNRKYGIFITEHQYNEKIGLYIN